MTPPTGSALGLAQDSPARALWGALRYLRAENEAVYVGKVVVVANGLLRRWNKKPMMESSFQRYLRAGHSAGLCDTLAQAGIAVHCGPQGGEKRGHVRVELPRIPAAIEGV